MLHSLVIKSLILALTGSLLFAAAVEEQDLFQKGLAAYQSKQYAEARDSFQKLLDQGQISASLLNNLALTVYELDQKPLALALWRKALSLRPGFPPAMKGRDFLESKMTMRPLEGDSFSLWAHRNLESISFYEILWFNALILAIAGWFGLKYWGERSAALEEELPLPPFPSMATAFLLILAFSLTVVVMKARDSSMVRATVTGAKATVRSLPSIDGVSLFDVNGGAEVLVRQAQSEWTQVQNTEGSSGWIKNSDIYVTSERQ